MSEKKLQAIAISKHIFPKMFFFHLLKVSHLGLKLLFFTQDWFIGEWISSFHHYEIKTDALLRSHQIDNLLEILREMAPFFKIRSSHF